MTIPDDPVLQVPSHDARGQPLEGWKAIATYAKRGVRTVQRWQHKGFPVYRHDALGMVYAYPVEIDAWRKSASDNSPSPAFSSKSFQCAAQGAQPAAGASIRTSVAHVDDNNAARSTRHPAGLPHQSLVWAGLVLTTAIVFTLAIFTVAYGFTILTFWLGAVVVTLGYTHLQDTSIARAFVAGYFITAMSYSASASTLPDVLATVINLTTLPPSASYSFAIGLKFIPLFILALIYWVILGERGFLAHPRLGKTYTLTGILFFLATLLCLAAVSADVHIWQAGLPGDWILILAYFTIFVANVAIWLLGRSCLKGEGISSYRQFLSLCVVAYLPVAIAAFFMDSEYNRINKYYLDVRWPEAYVVANPDAIKGFSNRLRDDRIGRDLAGRINDTEFQEALRTSTFYKQHFDEPFQIQDRAVMFGYRRKSSLDRGRTPFVTIRLPKEMADALRFESVGEQK